MELFLLQEGDNNMATGNKWIDKHELKRLLALMLPLYIANLLQMGMGVTDTLVAGWKGEFDLASVAMGFSICGTMMISCGAVLTILSAIISRLRGAGVDNKAGLFLNNGKVLAILLSLFNMGAIYAGSYAFQLTTDDPALAAAAQQYAFCVLLGAPAMMMMRVVSGNFEGYGQTRPAMIVSLLGLLLNIPLNYALVFGVGPFPELGGVGCGVATAIISWFNFGIMLAMMWGSTQHRARAKQMLTLRRPDWGIVGRIFKLGLPVGVAALCEMSFFCLITLIIAPLGETAVSAQQVALNVSGIIFMLPLSLSIAASIRAAYHVGARRADAFMAMVRTLFLVTFGLVMVLMLLTIFFRESIVGCYTDSAEIINTASLLLIMCAIYQIPDATQALMGGLLRGCHDTAIITWSNILSYWLIGFPLAYTLIHTDLIVPALGTVGAWISFIVSLTVTATILTFRFLRTRKKVFSK